MKKLYILFLFMVCAGYAQQQPFITTWEVSGSFLSIQIPIVTTENTTPNYTIDFGDGTILQNQTSIASHTYALPGIYTVTISGIVPHIHSPSSTVGWQANAEKLKTIEQWGDIAWESMVSAFSGCTNLIINATDSPDLGQVTDMTLMFENCTSLNQSLNHWNVTNITNMSQMFANCSSFNQPLNNWNVSNVNNMGGMFSEAKNFNQSLNSWNVNGVTNMSAMFADAETFNQPLDNWNVGNVTNMAAMFSGAESFNQPLNTWNVGNVTNMAAMFSDAESFNQSINSWNVSNVTDMNRMFNSCSSFNQPLDNWNVSNVIDMSYMFADAEVFNQPLNSWDVSNVTDMSVMFFNNYAFNQPLNSWDVSNVTNMSVMFYGCTLFNQPLNDWNITSLIYLNQMFAEATSFNQPLSNWQIESDFDIQLIFYHAASFNQDVSHWNFSDNDTEYVLFQDSGLDAQNYDKILLKFLQLGYTNKELFASNLKYCDEGVRNILVNQRGWSIYNDVLSIECPANNVTGTMLIDTDLNGCDATDAPAVNFMVKATNGTYNYGTFVNATGNYDLRVQEDTYIVTPVNIPDYFTVTPENAEVSFTGFGNSETLNFCLVPNQSVQDLNVTVLPIGDARPGFESQYKILIENIGTQSVTNATVTLTFDNTLQSFVLATPAPATTSANQLTFNVSNLGIFETAAINLTMTTFVPPVVNGGEVAVFTANVNPDAGDNTPLDNTFTLNQVIVNSYDPNDKRVVQGDEIYMEQTGEYLDYIIRFQNTGTASAITVRVEDILSDNLDWATLKPIAASHAYRVEVTEGNKVNFIFDNINLPHEAADAPGSNGYIAYKVKPKQGIQLGDVIAGNAGIYFDFNLPIITNTVTTTVVAPLGVKNNTKTAVSIYPNPAGDVVHLQTHPGTQVQQVNVYNLQGSELMRVSQKQNMETLNISSLSAGVYLLQVQTSTGRATYRLVKK